MGDAASKRQKGCILKPRCPARRSISPIPAELRLGDIISLLALHRSRSILQLSHSHDRLIRLRCTAIRHGDDCHHVTHNLRTSSRISGNVASKRSLSPGSNVCVWLTRSFAAH